MTSHTARNPVVAHIQDKQYVDRFTINVRHPMGHHVPTASDDDVCTSEDVAILERKFEALEREILMRAAHEEGSAGEWRHE